MYFVDINKTADLSYTPVIIREDTTKTDFRKRMIPIPLPLSEWVTDNISVYDPDSLVFTNKDNGILSRSAFQGRFNTYIKQMDIHYNNRKKLNDPTRTEKDRKLIIDRFTPYDCRHTYATLLAEIDTPVRKTTALMGHSTSATTDKYYIDWKEMDTAEAVIAFGKEIDRIGKET